jgi:hypothetical protein
MRPELLGLGASAGFVAGASALVVMAHLSRRNWS